MAQAQVHPLISQGKVMVTPGVYDVLSAGKIVTGRAWQPGS